MVLILLLPNLWPSFFIPRNLEITFDYPVFPGKWLMEMVPTVKHGILFNGKICWDEQVEVVRRELSRTVGVLDKFQYILPLNVKLIIYNALIQSSLRYRFLV